MSIALWFPRYNEAEWLVDMVTEADRQDQGPVFADAYATSELKRVRRWSGPCE